MHYRLRVNTLRLTICRPPQHRSRDAAPGSIIFFNLPGVPFASLAPPRANVCRPTRGLKASRAYGAGNFPNVKFEITQFEIRCRASCATNSYLSGSFLKLWDTCGTAHTRSACARHETLKIYFVACKQVAFLVGLEQPSQRCQI